MSGWKDWAIGEVVTESDFQSFVQDQVVQRYTDATDRDNTLGANVATGMAAYLETEQLFQVYDGSAWVEISGSGTQISDTPPGDPDVGDTWWDSTNGKFYVYFDSYWVQVQLGEAGPQGESGVLAVTSPITYDAGTSTVGIDESGLFTGGTAGQVVLSDGTSGLKFETGYVFRETVYFTSSGTFSKASYPWLKAIRVKCQGAGGGGANKGGSYIPASGGAGGNYAESFIENIASLASSVSVTVGAGGSAGASGGNNDGTSGGDSSFGSIVEGRGGSGGFFSQYLGGESPRFATGDIVFAGTDGQSVGSATETGGGSGGSSHLGGGGRGGRGIFTSQNNGRAGGLYGGGGGGSSNDAGGGDGADGIVILELFA